jgi:tetratricopeptide (TPR) repeat protein/serine phosphatase RsbU (regulator of sigma subunit)
MRKVFFLFAISFLILNSTFVIVEAQQQGQAKIDSLLKELPNIKEDTNAVKLLSNLSFEYYLINPDNGIKFGEQGVKVAKKIVWKVGLANCYNSLGVVNSFGKSDYDKGLEYYSKSLKIYEELDNKSGIATALGNIGSIYNFRSNYTKALEYYHKALKINEEIGRKQNISNNLGNIGSIYNYLSDFTKALEYYHKTLKINEEIGNKRGLASVYGGIGDIYFNQSDYPKALENYHKSLKINEELGNKSGLATSLRSIGLIFQAQYNYPEALEYYHKALKINQDLGNNLELAYDVSTIGKLYFILTQDTVLSKINEGSKYINLNKEINLNKSIKYFLESIKIFEGIGEVNVKSENFKYLAFAYSEKGDYKKAYEFYLKHKTMQDSVFSMEKQKEIANLEAKRENDLKNKEIRILQTEKKTQQFQSYLLGGGVIVLFGAFGVAFLRFREKKKLSDELQTQKSIVEEKNEEIVSSITYASTIQHAILPWDSTLKKAFSDIIIFYKPKDIVSGDSYWFQEVDGIKFLAVIDCTGHGIPGAMLTVIASSVLDDAVLSKKLTDTGDILTYMNEKVTEVLNQKLAENKIRDGMEVALIAIHNEKIQFSGAGRPLYMKNGTIEIIKTDKRGIAGQTENDDYQFSSVEIEMNENMSLYLTSDGFADQMNEISKKFRTKRFVALLDSISDKPTSEQSVILENEFINHKGERNQIDDITVLGVRV